jgi:hypothetical protein
MKKNLIFIGLFFCYLYSFGQKNDTVLVENYLLKSIVSARLNIFKGRYDKDVYRTNLVFINDCLNNKIELLYTGSFPLPYIFKNQKSYVLPIGNGKLFLRQDTIYSFKLIKICNSSTIKDTYYEYFSNFNISDCSLVLFNKPKKRIPKHNLLTYSNYFVVYNQFLYKIEFIKCPKIFEK